MGRKGIIRQAPSFDYYMPEELVAHITAGVAVGREPYFFGVAYEVNLVVVQALIMLAEVAGAVPSFNLNDIKNHISHQDLEQLKEKIDYIDTPDAQQLSKDMLKILSTPADYYSKVASSLRVALTELTSGNVGNITRKGINSLLMGRAMSLLFKAFLIYVLYLVLYRLSTPENIWKAAGHFGSRAVKIYYGFFEIKPHLLSVASESATLMVVAAIFPYGLVYFLDLWHRHRIKRNAKSISA